MQTAESVVAARGAPGVAAAMQRASARSQHMTLQQRVWILRCAFDALLDELDVRPDMTDGDTNAL